MRSLPGVFHIFRQSRLAAGCYQRSHHISCCSASSWDPKQKRLAFFNNHQKLCSAQLQPNLQQLGKCFRYSSSAAESQPVAQCLSHRSLIQVTGEDTLPFLQGIITNDTQLLQSENLCIYSFILNVQGRVLYDLLLYRIAGDHRVLIECDTTIAPEFLSLIRKYKIRRKVKLGLVDDEMKVWSLIPSKQDTGPKMKHPDVVACVPDPRVDCMGSRLILPSDISESVISNSEIASENNDVYRAHRYQLGVAEGIEELPPGNCFPLESNAVFLNAVNFNKGCFIGQELTARTHHLGVTRKRIMPLVFSSPTHTSKVGDTAMNEKGKNSGKVRGVHGQYGLALLRLPNVINTPKLTLQNATGERTAEATTHMPTWWHIASNKLITELLESQDKTPKS